ncbi:MAG: CPBP family intramembrane metalloprotease [Blautia sp.]|nr:CPBP family intramembrane metalloprotease [Blautia sp.]MCM1201288.1 CPBP family intramembrane metalloprotease [Bacteroides fragilis]
MNSKKVNWIFLSLILLNMLMYVLMLVCYVQGILLFEMNILVNLLLAQLVMMLPAILFALAFRRKTETGHLNEMLGFHKIRVSSFFMIFLFTYLIMPLTTALNAISMLFVENEVTAISGDVLQMPFPVMLFMIGMFGPFCEEFVFRGVIFRGYKNSGPVFWSIFWSALLFGLMHLNFNQAAYAVAIGILFGLLVEATGSLWSSVIAHMIFNSHQVCLMYLSDLFQADLAAAEEALTQEMLIAAIGPYLIIAAVATPLAVCVLVWLAKNERREAEFCSIWACRKMKKEAMVSIPLIIAIVISLAYMSLEWILALL